MGSREVWLVSSSGLTYPPSGSFFAGAGFLRDLFHHRPKRLTTIIAPTETPAPMPAFAPVDNPEDGVDFRDADGLLERVVVVLPDEIVDAVEVAVCEEDVVLRTKIERRVCRVAVRADESKVI